MNASNLDDVQQEQADSRPDESAELGAAAWVIEQLEIEAGQPSDRSRIRRAIEEASVAWPGEPRERWWRWVVEASESLGLRGRAVDCTFEQVWEVAREGARLVVRAEATGEWYGLAAVHGRKTLVLHPLTDQNRRWVSRRQLQQTLGDTGGVLRCVVLETLATDAIPEHLPPLSRAWGLLRPEARDIRIVILFAAVSGLLALATPLAIEALVSTVTFGRLLQPIVVLSLLLFVFLAFLAAIRGLQTFVVDIIQRRLLARVAVDLAYRLPRVRADAMENHSPRELVNRFFDIVTVQKVTAQFLLDGVSVAVNTIVGMAVLGFYHPWLLGYDVVLLGLIIFIIFVMGRGAISSSIKESKHKYEIASWLEDLAGNPIAFRYDSASQFALERADRLIYEYLSARRLHFRILLRQIMFALGLQAVASTVLLGLGGWLVISGQLTLGQLVAAELIVTVIVGSFAKLGKHMESFYDMMASVDKLGHLFDLAIERTDGRLNLQKERPASLTMTDVGYRHADGWMGLDGLNLSIAGGERIALSGSSGSGKSIIVDLLFGLRTQQRGHIEIDGIDPRSLRPDVLRRCVALVRNVEMFEGTIAENIHLERPDVGSMQVCDALQQVGALEQILAMPRGLETEVNATGYPLTSNQLRKLMLARAIVAQPTLLLIDGTLDALPDHEADDLMQFLADPARPWTLIVVTGRESLQARATREIRLLNGRVDTGEAEDQQPEFDHARTE